MLSLAAVATCQWYGTSQAVIIARPSCHLQEGTRAVVDGIGLLKPFSHPQYLQEHIFALLPLSRSCWCLGDIKFLCCAQYQVHTFDLSYLFWLRLRIAARYHYHRLGCATLDAPYKLAAFFVCIFSHTSRY